MYDTTWLNQLVADQIKKERDEMRLKVKTITTMIATANHLLNSNLLEAAKPLIGSALHELQSIKTD